MFLLIDEATVRQYKADLTDEIEPQINELLDRAEKGVKALFRKESQIQTKVRPLDIHVTKYFVERYVYLGSSRTSRTIKTCTRAGGNFGIQ